MSNQTRKKNIRNWCSGQYIFFKSHGHPPTRLILGLLSRHASMRLVCLLVDPLKKGCVWNIDYNFRTPS